MQDVSPAFFLVDKPVGPTSFRMVQLVRRALKIKKVGHAGTLDPFASGLLVICVGRAATKQISVLMESEKEYMATLKLGVETDSQDLTGEVVSRHEVVGLSWQGIETCLNGFVGEQLQQPPAFSALKYKGKPLYYYARKGIKIEKEPRPVFIREIEGLSWQDDLVRIRVVCSKGTYIRTLACDIGKVLGCGAHLVELRRIRSGGFSVDGAIPGESLDQDHEIAREMLLKNMLPADSGIADL
ncbi:MAG: tRNA pseudouridine(55) synthase TruB [Desulfobulbaceae bacterium]|nr:tRNA pseudouridine(55) synthase TruB [Desulfobulbaceae bacterium]